MTDKVKITWFVEDGYVSDGRPQHLELDLSDFAYCETEEERQAVIDTAVKEEFDGNVSCSVGDVVWPEKGE